MGKDDILNLSFEQAMGELETIVRRFEEGKVDLEEAMTLYERGNMIKNHCEGKLKDAELRVEKVTLSTSGDPQITPLSN